MRVLADLHHSDLYWSLHALFEKRLGWTLYRPIGRDWFDRGYWHIAKPYGDAPDTIAQYLEIRPGEFGLSNLNANAKEHERGIYRIWDPTHGYFQKAITFDGFMETDFDLVLSTVEAHDEPYQRLATEKGASFAVQMGNIGQKTSARNVLHSCRYEPTADQRAVEYHQEVDVALLRYAPPDVSHYEQPVIASMVNCLPHPEVFAAYEAAMPEAMFFSFGAACRNGFLMGCAEIAPEIRAASLGWHLKPLGGLGHTAMAWAASGRPIITNMGELRQADDGADRVFTHGRTCIAIDGLSVQEGVRAIRAALEPDRHQMMCEAVLHRFRQVCDYDAEEAKIRTWLEGVL